MIFPGTVRTPALDLIDQHLAEAAATRDARLIITMAPQEGKSLRVARDFPLWYLQRRPLTRIAVASYGEDLAVRNGKAIRNAITGNPQLGLTLSPGDKAMRDWRLSNRLGGVRSIGIGGGITGHAVDCVSADTLIYCEYGPITAEDAHRRGISRILAYDHASGEPAWCAVEASRCVPGRSVLEITTHAGRVLTCTPDHRVYTSRGYVPAGSLRAGDTLVALVDADRVSLRDRVRTAENDPAESDTAGRVDPLQRGVRTDGDSPRKQDSLLSMRTAHPSQPPADMLARVPGPTCATNPAALRGLRAAVRAVAHHAAVLLHRLRQRSTRETHDPDRQPELQGRQELLEVVSVDATTHPGTRRSSLRGMRQGARQDLHPKRTGSDPLNAVDSPHRRGREEQHRREPYNALPRLPHDPPQVRIDTVRLVRARSGAEVDVYDFQVAGTRNFFADGLLVHNCLIIDDPIKSQAEADSETFRDNNWDWWQTEAASRLAAGAPVILILTRWHHDDLAGRLLAQPDSQWQLLNIPAQAETNPDTLGRQPGEYMISARGRTPKQWELRKAEAGSRRWQSLYQGHPSPSEGGMFPRTSWRHWYQPPPLNGVVIQSWDMAFKGTDTSDYVVGQVWLQSGADLYLLDQVRGRWTFTETCRQVTQLTERWPMATAKLVEDKANGTAVIDSLRRTIPGLIPIEPQGGKAARAAAVSPLIEAGNVHLPNPADHAWVGDLIEEAAAFPTGTHDDQVDALTQALTWLAITQPTTHYGTTFFDIG